MMDVPLRRIGFREKRKTERHIRESDVLEYLIGKIEEKTIKLRTRVKYSDINSYRVPLARRLRMIVMAIVIASHHGDVVHFDMINTIRRAKEGVRLSYRVFYFTQTYFIIYIIHSYIFVFTLLSLMSYTLYDDIDIG